MEIIFYQATSVPRARSARLFPHRHDNYSAGRVVTREPAGDWGRVVAAVRRLCSNSHDMQGHRPDSPESNSRRPPGPGNRMRGRGASELNQLVACRSASELGT